MHKLAKALSLHSFESFLIFLDPQIFLDLRYHNNGHATAILNAVAYLELCETSKIELLANDWKQLTTFAKSSILVVSQTSKYDPAIRSCKFQKTLEKHRKLGL